MRAGKEVMSLFRELSYTTCSHSQFSAFCGSEEEHVTPEKDSPSDSERVAQLLSVFVLSSAFFPSCANPLHLYNAPEHSPFN